MIGFLSLSMLDNLSMNAVLPYLNDFKHVLHVLAMNASELVQRHIEMSHSLIFYNFRYLIYHHLEQWKAKNLRNIFLSVLSSLSTPESKFLSSWLRWK